MFVCVCECVYCCVKLFWWNWCEIEGVRKVTNPIETSVRKKRREENSPGLKWIAQADSCKCVSIVAQGEASIFILEQQELANWYSYQEGREMEAVRKGQREWEKKEAKAEKKMICVTPYSLFSLWLLWFSFLSFNICLHVSFSLMFFHSLSLFLALPIFRHILGPCLILVLPLSPSIRLSLSSPN